MEIQFEPEIQAILERDAVGTFGSKGTPEEFVKKIVNDFFTGKPHQSTTREGLDLGVIGNCMPLGNTFSSAITAFTEVAGVVKSVIYDKSDDGFRLEARFSPKVDKKKSDFENRLAVLKIEIGLSPPTPKTE